DRRGDRGPLALHSRHDAKRQLGVRGSARRVVADGEADASLVLVERGRPDELLLLAEVPNDPERTVVFAHAVSEDMHAALRVLHWGDERQTRPDRRRGRQSGRQPHAERGGRGDRNSEDQSDRGSTDHRVTPEHVAYLSWCQKESRSFADTTRPTYPARR